MKIRLIQPKPAEAGAGAWTELGIICVDEASENDIVDEGKEDDCMSVECKEEKESDNDEDETGKKKEKKNSDHRSRERSKPSLKKDAPNNVLFYLLGESNYFPSCFNVL